jgi:hypothetical protein
VTLKEFFLIHSRDGKYGYQGRLYFLQHYASWIKWYLTADLGEIYRWDIKPHLPRKFQ